MELSSHVPEAKRKLVGKLVLSPGCEHYLKKRATELGVGDLGCLPNVLAGAVASFLELPHWKSPWWREQQVHAIMAFQVRSEDKGVDGNRVEVLLHKSASHWTVLAPDEFELPTDYRERRLIEEVKVEFFPECFK